MQTSQETSSEVYTKDFFQNRKGKTAKSSDIVAPIITDFFKQSSMIDVGCGTGEWLKSFMDIGIKDVCGVDGHHVPRNLLKIPEELFNARDLFKSVGIERKFDLAMSLEVAEHLPESRADSFVKELCDLAPIVVFSAATPGQGGAYHVNEQWPEYWAAKFAANGRVVVDCIRDLVWHDPRVAYHYVQNTLVFITPEKLESFPELKKLVVTGNPPALARIHPEKWRRALDVSRMGLKRWIKAFVPILKVAIQKRFK